MKIIYTSKLEEIQVSDEDYDYLIQVPWWLSNSYPATDVGRKIVQMGIFVARRMNLSLTDCIDHKDRNKLNNQRSNIRVATKSQNAMNIGIMATNTSGYKGVYFDNRGTLKKWFAKIFIRGTQIYLGYFETPKEAARAYNRAAKMYQGEFAVLNEV